MEKLKLKNAEIEEYILKMQPKTSGRGVAKQVEALYAVLGFMFAKSGIKMKQFSPELKPFYSHILRITDEKVANIVKEPLTIFEEKIDKLIVADSKLEKLKPLKQENKELQSLLYHEQLNRR